MLLEARGSVLDGGLSGGYTGFEGADISLHDSGKLIPHLLWQRRWRGHKNVSYATGTWTGKRASAHLPERLPKKMGGKR